MPSNGSGRIGLLFRFNTLGLKIDNKSLLEYLCSFRSHASYHEDCCEKIFYEIFERCKPVDLTISLNFSSKNWGGH